MLDSIYHIISPESKTHIFDFHIFQERQKLNNFCYAESDRIIFSIIQIHCYLCFELPIKISQSS